MNDNNYNHDDGVRGFSLARLLWGGKWTVLLVALIVGLAATVYVSMAKPMYEAAAFVIPPTQNEIANFNYGRTNDTELSPLTVQDVYSVFLHNLKGEQLRQAFIREEYLPALSADERQDSPNALYAELSKRLVVSQPAKDMPDRYMVVVQADDPAQAVKWVKEYVSKAGELARKELIKNISIEAEVRARNIHQQIVALRENSRKIREDAITKLREALRVAEAIGLERPPIISGNPAVEIAGSMDAQLIYMRGTRALKAEIENLEARESDDPFIGQLRSLEAKYNFYKELQANSVDVSVYRLDGDVEQSSSPVRPKKALIVMLGFVVGLMLGTILVLIIYFHRRDAGLLQMRS